MRARERERKRGREREKERERQRERDRELERERERERERVRETESERERDCTYADRCNLTRKCNEGCTLLETLKAMLVQYNFNRHSDILNWVETVKKFASQHYNITFLLFLSIGVANPNI